MSKYNDTVLTTAGLDLVTRAGEGQTSFKITKAEATADDLSATDLSTLTAIPNVVQTGSIVGSDAATTGVMGIKIQFTNTHLSKSYSANAIGVYATETDGKEVLYAVTTAETGHAQYMPDFSGGVKLDFGIVINVVIGKASRVTVQFDTDGLATIGFVQDAVAGLKNVAKTDEANTFTQQQTLAGGATDGEGNAYATTKDVAIGLNNGLSTKVTDNKDGTIKANNLSYDLSKTGLTQLCVVKSGSFNDLPLGTVFAGHSMTDGPNAIHWFTTTTFLSSEWGGRKAQIAISDNTNHMYFRTGFYASTGISWNNWILLSDDSKVAHLSGANNFDTVPTVNNNPLLLASSLPSDLARTSQQTNFTDGLQKGGKDVATVDEVADAKAAAITQALNDAKAEIAKLPKHVTLTKAQFDALATKDANTYYYITAG